VKPKYFCENCGSEVKPGAASCPTCGSRFTSVRCPKCGYEGKESAFRTGCPACGYMEALPGPASGPGPVPGRTREPFLPAWFYRAAVIVLLAAVIVLLVVVLTRT
jgi:hypothetical protein